MWEENYHRAVYFYLTAGAVLCRAYLEPLLDTNKPKRFLDSLVGILEGRRNTLGGSRDREREGQSQRYEDWFTEEEKAYIRGIPLYNSQASSQWVEKFSELESLLLQQTRSRSLHIPRQSVSHPHPYSGLKKPLLQLYGRNSRNPGSLDKKHHETLFNSLLQFLYLIDGDMRYLISLPGDTTDQNQSPNEVVHSTQAFLYGSFTLMDITIRRGKGGNEGIFAGPLSSPSPSDISKVSTFPYMHNYLKKIHDASGLPNTHGDPIWKTPPLVTFFIEYMLRRYFGLRFRYTMFDATLEVRCAWCAFHQYGGVFTGYGPGCGCSIGGDLLMSMESESPPVVFDQDAWYY